MKPRILFIIMALLFTFMGGARAENTFTIKVNENHDLSNDELNALQVLANYEQVLTITESSEHNQTCRVMYNGVELFYYYLNYYRR